MNRPQQVPSSPGPRTRSRHSGSVSLPPFPWSVAQAQKPSEVAYPDWPHPLPGPTSGVKAAT